MARAEPFQVRLPAVAENIARARQLATDHLAALDGVSRTCLDAVRLALTEAVTNSVVHAYRDREQAGDIEIEITPDSDRLDLTVRDHGCRPIPNPESPGMGMGIPLMASLSQKFEIHGGPGEGTRVRMTFRR